MASSGNDNLGYKTYILGTTKTVTDSLRIMLYSKNDLSVSSGIPRINIYNIDEVIEKLKNPIDGVDRAILLIKNDVKDPFKYIANNGLLDGFDVIIYLSNTDSSKGTGYTEFINKQGENRNIDIYLDFTTVLEDNININIGNSLSTASNISNKVRVGTELWEYTSLEDIENEKDKRVVSPSLFTTHLTSFIGSGSESNIYMSSMGAVIGNINQVCNFRMAREFNIDPYRVGFNNHQVGYYEGRDVSCYSWSGLKYSISSLSEVNRFGAPVRHTDQSQGGYVEIKGVPQSSSILMFSGRYALIQTTNRIRLYDTVLESLVSSDYGTKPFVDETSRHNTIIKAPSESSFSNLNKLVPDLGDTFYNIRQIGELEVIGRKEGWLILKYGNHYLFSGLRSSLIVHSSEFRNVILINDIFIGLKTNEDNSFFVYSPGGNYKSEKYKSESSKSLTYDEDLDIYRSVKEENNEEEYNTYTKYYKDGTIKIIKDSIPINKTWLGRFIRNSYPKVGSFPTISSIISAVSGVIFYINGSNVNYL